jgi:hypothetical protein
LNSVHRRNLLYRRGRCANRFHPPNAPGFFVGPLRMLLVGFRAAVPKKGPARRGPALLGVSSSAFLSFLGASPVNQLALRNWCLTQSGCRGLIPSSSRQIPSHPFPKVFPPDSANPLRTRVGWDQPTSQEACARVATAAGANALTIANATTSIATTNPTTPTQRHRPQKIPPTDPATLDPT